MTPTGPISASSVPGRGWSLSGGRALGPRAHRSARAGAGHRRRRAASPPTRRRGRPAWCRRDGRGAASSAIAPTTWLRSDRWCCSVPARPAWPSPGRGRCSAIGSAADSSYASAGDPGTLRGSRCCDADHPLPSAASHEAGRRARTSSPPAAARRPRDHRLHRVAPQRWPACRRTASLRRQAGSARRSCSPAARPIEQINAVRKHVSAIKGGRLAASMPGATAGQPDRLRRRRRRARPASRDPVVQDTSRPSPRRCSGAAQPGLWDAGRSRGPRPSCGPGGATSPRLAGLDIASRCSTDGEPRSSPRWRGRVRSWAGRRSASDAARGRGSYRRAGCSPLSRVESAPATDAVRRAVRVARRRREAVVTLIQRRPHADEPAPAGRTRRPPSASPRAIAREPVRGRARSSSTATVRTAARAHAGGSSTARPRARAASRVDLDAALPATTRAGALRLGDLVVTGPTGTNISDLIVALDICRPRSACRSSALARAVTASDRVNRHDAVIIGGGHNGLVAAFYLARAGLRPLVLERRDVRRRRVRHRGVRARLPRLHRRLRARMLRPAIWRRPPAVERRGITSTPAGPTLNLFPDGAHLLLDDDLDGRPPTTCAGYSQARRRRPARVRGGARPARPAAACRPST